MKFGPAINSPWRCSTSAARPSRIPGSPGTTRWAVLRAFERELRDLGERYLLGSALEPAGPRPGRPAAGILGTRASSHEPILASGSLAGGLALEDAWTRIDVRDGEKGTAGRRGRQASGASQDRDRRDGPGGVALRGTREAQSDGKFKHDYYLSNADPEETLKGVGEGIPGGAPGRGMLPARQERGGTGRLPGEDLARLAPSSDPVAAGRVVPESGDAAGKKS